MIGYVQTFGSMTLSVLAYPVRLVHHDEFTFDCTF